MNQISPEARRRRHLLVRGALATVAASAFITGLIVGSEPSERVAVERFAAAWEEGDFGAMHAELTEGARARTSVAQLERAYVRAARTATIDSVTLGSPRGPLEQNGETVVAVPIEVRTKAFGTVVGELAVPVSDRAIDWRASMVFPGLEPGEELERRTRAPRRARILARDRAPLAEGPVDARVTQHAGGTLTGELGAPPTERSRRMAQQGFPEETLAGNSGLELAFDGQLAGQPGGQLLAVPEGRNRGGSRMLAEADPQPGRPLRTTIDPDLQQAAVEALGERFGGIAVLDTRSGEVRALAGIAFSAPQPPGSVFKIITAVAGLESGATKPDQRYEVVRTIDAGGREIRNADEAACGGTLAQSFADSCNTVFAPLGVEIGGEKLLEVAERFGFNSLPALYAEDVLAVTQPPASSIPDPIGADVDLAASAIGQGQVLATPLLMASVAQAIANDGVRSPTPLVKDPDLRGDHRPVEATDSETAGLVRDFMVEVVRSGTGQAAALPESGVAGKTGTAELGPAADQPLGADPDSEPEMELNAWFAGFAPARRPRLAVAVMIVDAGGHGGDIAAPIAREVLAAGLGG